jgi:hypothetical protein
MFPNQSSAFSFTKLRQPRGLTKEFALKAKALGFQALRFSRFARKPREALLDAGVPVHVVAARCGDDPALRSYAKRTNKADAQRGGGDHRGVWVQVGSKPGRMCSMCSFLKVC